jgi:hypothetical protein
LGEAETPFTIQYGSGSVAGVFGHDVVRLGSVAVQQQVFAEVLTGSLSNGFMADGTATR